MQFFISFLYVFEVIICLLLGGIIMLQKPKEGGLGVAIGGGMGEALFGAQMSNVLTKATVVLAAIFLLNTLALSRLTTSSGASLMERVKTAPAAQTQEPLPFTPPAE